MILMWYADFVSPSPILNNAGFCALLPIQTTQDFDLPLTYEVMYTHICMHAHLIILYPLTSSNNVIIENM